MDLKVLWTIADGMGTVADLAMLRGVQGMNIAAVTADREDKDSLGFAITGKKYIVPSGESPDYLASILAICQRERVTTLIPQYDDELAVLARNILMFAGAGVKVLVTPDAEKLDIANNKTALYDYFAGRSFVPRYRCVTALADMEQAVRDLGYPDEAVCMKPASSEGSKGFRIITAEKADILSERPGTAKIRWDVVKGDLEQYGELPAILVMEYLPGIEYSVDCVCKDGKPIVCIPRQRVATSLGVAVESVIEQNEELIALSQEIIKSLNLSYNINIQFKYSRAGTPKLVEINPRVSGSLVANLGAGVNMLELSLKLAYGLPLPAINVKWGTRMIRYWDQLFI
jgi:Carbamoylphosphate synthase large subunit (split gene in MJ)